MRALIVVVLGIAAMSCDVGGRDELLVSAAASLSLPFAEMAEEFEEAHPEIDVVLNTGSSSSLRDQIVEGASVDVYASADTFNMEVVVDAGLLDGVPIVFATNRMLIAVPPGNPAEISDLGDLARPEFFIGLCAEGVPCGDLARVVLTSEGVEAAVDTNEPDVRSLLTKIEAGELDAGIVYASDVVSAGGAVEGVEFEEADPVVTEYPIGVVAGAKDLTVANAFIGFVTSDRGRAILASHGFSQP